MKNKVSIKYSVFILILFISFNIKKTTAQNKKAFPIFLPTLSGEYKIGTTYFFIDDTTRSEIYTRKKNDFRRLHIKAWYPSDINNADTAIYIPGNNQMILTSHYWWMGASRKFFKKLSYAKTNSCVDVPTSNKEKKYPVIIFSHGYGISLPEFYSSLLENLASNGYIVLAINHPYESIIINYPDGSNTKRGNIKNLLKTKKELSEYRKINDNSTTRDEKVELIKKIKKESVIIKESHSEWVKDSRFIVDILEDTVGLDWKMLTNKFDINKIGALGHSFGGSVTGQFCIEDSRIKAGVNIDGWQYGDVFEKGHNSPFMFIGSVYNDWYDLFFEKNKTDFYKVIIPDMHHFSFSDMSVFPKMPDRLKMKYLGTTNPVPLIKLSNSIVLNFFDHYLKSMPLKLEEKYITGFSNVKQENFIYKDNIEKQKKN